MSNRITASVEFYFRGKKIASSIELDLDQHMQNSGKLPDLYPLLAHAAKLDLYSYQFEMMQAEAIMFSNATGLAVDFVNEGRLDMEAFIPAWIENKLLEDLQTIARQNLSVDDLHQQPELKQALLDAYRLGENAAQKNR